MALSDAQLFDFEQRGIARLAGVFMPRDATAMLNGIQDELRARQDLGHHDTTTWASGRPTGFQALTRAGAFASIAESPILCHALDDLLGRGGWKSQKAWGVPLVTFPEPGRVWEVPAAQWHLDFPARAISDGLPGVRILAFLHTLCVHGGGTVVATGSHRLVKHLVDAREVKDGRSQYVRQALADLDPWFRCLWGELASDVNRVRRCMTEGACVQGHSVRVEELTGVAGDVILMHPWLFHAPAPNCGKGTRVMIAHSVFRACQADLH